VTCAETTSLPASSTDPIDTDQPTECAHRQLPTRAAAALACAPVALVGAGGSEATPDTQPCNTGCDPDRSPGGRGAGGARPAAVGFANSERGCGGVGANSKVGAMHAIPDRACLPPEADVVPDGSLDPLAGSPGGALIGHTSSREDPRVAASTGVGASGSASSMPFKRRGASAAFSAFEGLASAHERKPTKLPHKIPRTDP